MELETISETLEARPILTRLITRKDCIALPSLYDNSKSRIGTDYFKILIDNLTGVTRKM
jgi:hypothetical protein